jgi:hypothetical protein
MLAVTGGIKRFPAGLKAYKEERFCTGAIVGLAIYSFLI